MSRHDDRPGGPPRAVRRTAALALAALVVGGGAGACTKTNDPSSTTPTSSPTQGTTASGGATFGLPLDPGAAIKSAGLPEIPLESPPVLMPPERTHLDVSVNGQPVVVPAEVGVTKTARAPIYTRDTSGVIWIEPEKTDKPEIFTIGQFFTEWGVKLDKTCVATYCTDDTNQLLGYLDGQLVPDPASIPLRDGAEIVIWYGPKTTNPKVPSSYVSPPLP